MQKTNDHMEEKIINILKDIFDPDIPVNIYDLGLIYKIDISDNNDVKILMTLTSPNCPIADDIIAEVYEKLRAIENIGNVDVKITFEPPWDKNMMSEEALLELGLL